MLALATLLAVAIGAAAEQNVDVCFSSGCVKGAPRQFDRVFFNIPYAEPPIGAGRFAPPRPPASDCTYPTS